MEFCGLLNIGLCWLALNVYHESRGEAYEAQVDTANVVLNRVESKRFPDTIQGVVTQGGERRHKCQFSWYCDGVTDDPTDTQAWSKAIAAAVAALNGDDTTDGALYYYNPLLAKPYWATSYQYVKISGSHVLLK